jgi:hypothetical protein
MKKSSFFSIVSSVLLSASLAFSAGKIQNEDVKSVSDLISAGSDATHLINDDKVWVKALGINLTFDDAILYQALLNGITSTTRDSIPAPVTNQIIYNITTNEFETYNGVSWAPLTAGLPGGSQYSIQTNSGSSSLYGDSYFLYNDNQAIFDLVDSYGGLHVEGRGGGEASFALQPDTVTNGTAGQWIFYTNGSQLNNQNDFAMFNSQLGSPTLILQSATNNVGIGTNNPGVPLDVAGASRVTSTSNAAVVFSIVGNAVPQTVDYLDVTFNGGTAGNIFNISSAGYVGINTTTPAATLDVKGSFNLDGSTSGYFQQSASPTTTSYGIVWPAAQGAANTIPINDGSGNLRWSPAIGGMNATNIVRSNSTGAFLFSNSQIPILDSGGINPVTVTVTTTGEDVVVGFMGDGTNQGTQSGLVETDTVNFSYCEILFYRDATFIGASSQFIQTNLTYNLHGVPASGYSYVDSPPPGVHTYTAQVIGAPNRGNQGIYYSVLYAKPVGNGLGVAFKATGSGSWTTSNPIPLSTVLWDTNSAYNTSTGQFTAPSSAFYIVGWNGNATGGLKQVVIYVNGAPQDLIDNGYSYDPDAIGTSGLFQLNAGDVVTWVAQDNFSTNETVEWAISMGGVTSTAIVPHPGEILPNYSPSFFGAPTFGWLDISDLDQTNLATEFGSTDTAMVANNTSEVLVLSGSNTAVSSTGNTGAVVSNSGNITDSGASGNTGNNSLGTGSNAGSGTTGSANVGTGNATGTGASGSTNITTGNSAAAGSGNINVSTGSVVSGQTPGSILLTPGQDGSNNYGTVHFNAHLKSTQSVVPTAVVNANAGSGATCSLTDATDSAGNVDLVTTASSPAAGDQCDITFTQVYAVAPVCVLSAISPNGSLLVVSDGIYFSTSTTALTINFANADLVGNTYDWSYHCVETQ